MYIQTTNSVYTLFLLLAEHWEQAKQKVAIRTLKSYPSFSADLILFVVCREVDLLTGAEITFVKFVVAFCFFRWFLFYYHPKTAIESLRTNHRSGRTPCACANNFLVFVISQYKSTASALTVVELPASKRTRAIKRRQPRHSEASG